MQYNNHPARTKILETVGEEVFFGTKKKVRGFISLCLYPLSWESVYCGIQENDQLTPNDWNGLVGFLYATHVLIHRKNKYTYESCLDMAPDFVEYIRNGIKERDNPGYCWRFAIQTKNYMFRYSVLKGLQRFGVDWRELATSQFGATIPPRPQTYSSLFTNRYVRSTIKAMVVFRTYRDAHEPDYEPGVNDYITLLQKESSSKKCVDFPYLKAGVDYLKTCLPSWNAHTRGKVGYFIDYNIPVTQLSEVSYEPFKFKGYS